MMDGNADTPLECALWSRAIHDLRQPLQAISLLAEAVDGHVADVQGREVTANLKDAARTLDHMFESLFLASRLISGDRFVQKEECRLDRLVVVAVEAQKPVAKALNKVFETKGVPRKLSIDKVLAHKLVTDMLIFALSDGCSEVIDIAFDDAEHIRKNQAPQIVISYLRAKATPKSATQVFINISREASAIIGQTAIVGPVLFTEFAQLLGGQFALTDLPEGPQVRRSLTVTFAQD